MSEIFERIIAAKAKMELRQPEVSLKVLLLIMTILTGAGMYFLITTF
jgi:hypothetical protein